MLSSILLIGLAGLAFGALHTDGAYRGELIDCLAEPPAPLEQEL